MKIEELFARLNAISERLESGDRSAELAFWSVLHEVEVAQPEFANREAIAEWLSQEIAAIARRAGHLKYSSAEYLARVNQLASRLRFPFLLLKIPDELRRSNDEPMEMLDDMIRCMPV